MKTVLFVTEYYSPKIFGGGEINAHLLARALAMQGAKVHVLTSAFKGLPKRETIDQVVVHRQLRTGSRPDSFVDNLARAVFFRRSVATHTPILAKKIGADVVHLFGSAIRAAGSITSTPVFSTMESYLAVCPKGDRLYHGKKPCRISCTYKDFGPCLNNSSEVGKLSASIFQNPIMKTSLFRYYRSLQGAIRKSTIIAISGYVKNLLKQEGITSHVVPNCIDSKRFSGTKKSNQKPVISYLGSLTRFKGPQTLIKAVDGIDCEVRLYGEGAYDSTLRQMATTKASIRFYGQVPYEQVPSLYLGSDIVVFPSLWPEPFGRIPIEAMAAGVPVIGSDIGGIKETISTKTGLLFPPGDVKELKKAIIKLIKNPTLRIAMGKEGKKAAQEYSLDAVGKKLLDVYRGP